MLARVSLPYPAHVNRDRSLTREFVDKLMYVLTVHHQRCTPLGGPAPLPGTTPAPVKPSPCTFTSYVDARTGHEEYAQSIGTGTS